MSDAEGTAAPKRGRPGISQQVVLDAAVAAFIDHGYDATPAKFAALDELLSTYFNANAWQKVIVWTSFVQNIAELQHRYAALKPVVIFGEVSGPERDKAVDSFLNEPSVRLMIANPAAAREGLTLTSANVVVYLDRTFNLVDFLQSQDRIHRISQERPCEIVLLIAEHTIDEFVDFSLGQKHRLARFAQSDSDTISEEDLELRKPELLRALLAPGARA